MPYGEVITFYSYKGGVGRSMALANTATLLAQGGKRVLTMDFDLEAPGLLRYFKRVEAPATGAGGVIEFFSELRRRFEEARPRTGSAVDPDGLPATALGSELEEKLRASVTSLVDDPRFFRRVTVANPNLPGDVAQLWLMPAGHYDPSYPDRVRRFPWDSFYEAHPYFVEFLIQALTERYDYVLIDSRTGTTDVGNVCTVLLPEKLVLVSTPNEQSLNGATEVGRQAVEMRKASADLRPLPLFPLLSRVENAEDALQRTWIRDAKSRFEAVFAQVYGIQKPLTVYFDTVQIPHKSFYAYGELIAAERERLTEARSLVAAYREFVDALRSNNAVDAQELMSARVVAPSAAQEAASVALQRNAQLTQKVLDAEARTQHLEKRLHQLQPGVSEVPLEVSSLSEASPAPARGSRRWLWGAGLAGLAGLAIAGLFAKSDRQAASPISTVRPSEPTLSSPGLELLPEASPARAAPESSPPTPPLAQSLTPPRMAQTAVTQRSRPGAALVPPSPPAEPDLALRQIVRGDFQREKLDASVLPETFNGRALVLGSYSSPTQAQANLARIRKSVGDAQVYYSSDRFYAVAAPVARGSESWDLNDIGYASLLAPAEKVSPDAYVNDAHGWLQIAFR